MIDPRLQALLGDTGAAETDTAPAPTNTAQIDGTAQTDDTAEVDTRTALINLAAEINPSMAPIAEAATSEIRMGHDGTITASPALRAAMRAMVPGRDKAPAGCNRVLGGWLSADTTTTSPVTATSAYFSVSHWHWLAAQNLVRRIPADLGPTFPHLYVSESQIVHDLKAWEALDEHGHLTDEASEMFGAVTGHAELSLHGTVLLYAQRRAPVQLPAVLEQFGLAAAVRNVPRVTFVIGITAREVVTALVNNTSVVFTRRLRRTTASADAAAALLELLDPDKQWPAYPLATPIVLPGSVVDELATGKDTAGLIDTEPGEDASDEERNADAARRAQVRKGARAVLGAARTPAAAAEAIAEIAAATTHALAQVTVRTNQVDVGRASPGALAVVFLRARGILASYPSGSGQMRRTTYVTGNASGIELGIKALRDAYQRV